MRIESVYRCIRWSLTGAAAAAVLLAWGGLAAPGALAAGGSGPAMTALEPDEGPVGTEVAIRGESFGSAIGAVQGTSGVSFGGVWASPSSWSEGEVRVAVPAGAMSGPVVVTVGGVASEGVEFTVTGPGPGGPAVGTVSPSLGPAGTEVVITGTGFGEAEGAEQGTAAVSFNGVAGTPTSWSGTEIRVAVPEGVERRAGGGEGGWSGEQRSGVHGDTGRNGAAVDRFREPRPGNGRDGGGDPWGELRRGSGAGEKGRELRRSVGRSRAGGARGRSGRWCPRGSRAGRWWWRWMERRAMGWGSRWTGPAPVIETVDPTHGPEGTGVVIRGEHFGSPIGAVQGRAGVSFGGVWAEPSLWSGTEIRATAPEGVESGQVMVTAGGQESNGVEFTVPAGGKGLAWARAVYASTEEEREEETAAAEITSLTPDAGSVGTSVTVAGTGFGAVQGDSRVSFNGTAGVPSFWSEAEIRVPMPAGIATGPAEVTVEVTVGGRKSNGVEFLLDPPVIIEVSDKEVSEPGRGSHHYRTSRPRAVYYCVVRVPGDGHARDRGGLRGGPLAAVYARVEHVEYNAKGAGRWGSTRATRRSISYPK